MEMSGFRFHPVATKRVRKYKSQSQDMRVYLRSFIGSMYVLPDFLIMGAQKCGTTSLYTYLAAHPNVFPPLVKGAKYFTQHYSKGPNWYRAHFPSAFRCAYNKKFHNIDIVTGESSPDYMPDPSAPERILKLIPDVKLIALLRNPVDRAYSHYHYRLVRNRESLSFDDAIQLNKKELEDGWHSIRHNRGVYNSYLARGLYVYQLETWMSVFPKDQLLVLSNEQLSADPHATYAQVLEFLGLPQAEPPTQKKYNKGRYESMAPETRSDLIDYFNSHNQRLYEYLGKEFGWDR